MAGHRPRRRAEAGVRPWSGSEAAEGIGRALLRAEGRPLLAVL